MRPISPELAFQAALQIDDRRGATVTKGDAEKALREIAGAPDAARIVADWIDKHPGQISQRARQVLVDFVHKAPGSAGQSAVDVQAKQSGMRRLEQLLRGDVKREVHLVSGWLDAAQLDFQTARTQLTSLAQDAMKHFGADVGRLFDLAKSAVSGHVVAMAQQQQKRLRDIFSLKYPSDAEDQGSVTMTSQKYPSDNEDTGASAPVGPKRVSASHAAAIEKSFAQKTPAWVPGGVVEHHAGERFAQVKLGPALTAFIPTGPLAPTATPRDPESVRTFYVEKRSGALTESCGPFTI